MSHENKVSLFMDNLLTSLSTSQFSLRPSQESDRPFLFMLYAAINSHELDSMHIDPLRRDTYLMSRFSIEHRKFSEEFPKAEMVIIFQDDEPIGRLYFEQLESEFYLIDLSLMPAHQRHGIGSSLINNIKKHAGQNPVVVEVEQTNSAIDFFLACEFEDVGKEDIYIILEYKEKP